MTEESQVIEKLLTPESDPLVTLNPNLPLQGHWGKEDAVSLVCRFLTLNFGHKTLTQSKKRSILS